MLEMAENLGLDPEWGPRTGVLYELSVLGAHISDVMCSPPNPDEFTKVARELLCKAEEQAQWLWNCEDPCGNAGELRHIVWSDVLECSNCGASNTYWDASVRHNPLRLAKSFSCIACKKSIDIDSCERELEQIYDPHLKKLVTRRKREISRVFGVTMGSNWQRPPLESDYKLIDRIKKQKVSDKTPLTEIEWGDLYRSGYHQGITHLHHFYTDRNFFAMSFLWGLIDEYPKKYRPALQMLLLSYNSSHSTLMSRVVVKKNQQDLVLTGSQSGVLYISGLPVEKNIFRGVKKKIGSLERAFSLVWDSKSEVKVYNKSSERLSLENKSIDYVFTDPPFGDYIPYAEINQINEGWLKKLTRRKSEVIISKGQGKGLSEYEVMMKSVFSEVSRVMKKKALATVVFHSASAAVWKALINSYLSSGLAVKKTSILDKVQNSFKQTVSSVSVKGDPIILLSKPEKYPNDLDNTTTANELFSEVLRQASTANSKSEMEPERLYSRYITLSLLKGVDVSIDASSFYARINEAINESR